MPIRKRILKDRPVRNTTGLRVLEMLTRNGNERTLCQKCIIHHIRKVWSLDALPSRIVAAELSYAGRALLIMTNDSAIHTLDLSDVLP